QKLLVLQEDSGEENETDGGPRDSRDERQSQNGELAKVAAARQEIAHPAEPGEERHQRREVEGRDPVAVAGRVGAVADGAAVRAEVPAIRVVPDRQMKRPAEKRENAQDEPGDEADEVEAFPAHETLLCRRRRDGMASDSGRSTWRSRSARLGVSRISRISARQRREFGCFARARSAWLTSLSRRNRSAPEMSQRSSLSSSPASSEESSVWNPSGSSTRKPGWTLKKRARSDRVLFVMCGRAPLSICER